MKKLAARRVGKSLNERERTNIDRIITVYYDGLSVQYQTEDAMWGEYSFAQFVDEEE